MAESKKFIWVEINRDFQPELAKTFFNVSAYPSHIVLTAKKEKVYRFQGYMKPPDFIKELDEGLRRNSLYKAGKEWDEPTPRPSSIADGVVVATMKAPLEKVPAGIAFLDKDMWVAFMGGSLFKLDPTTGDVKQKFEIGESVIDLCTDGKVLYGLESGWTAGKPIHVIDPITGKTIRTIITKANAAKSGYGAKGIVWLDDKLYVLEFSGSIHELAPETGDIIRTIQTKQPRSSSLAFDGENFVMGGAKDLILINPKTGDVIRRVAVNYPLRSVGYSNGEYYLMEQPIFGFDKTHKSIMVWPKQTLIYKMKLPSA